MIRPERIELVRDRPSAGDAIQAKITNRIFSGELLSFELEAASGAPFRCTKPSLPQFRALERGQAVWMVPTDCRALPRVS
jgi:hypothetical protein